MKLRTLSAFVLVSCFLLMASCTTSHDYSLAVTCEDFDDNPNNESEFTLEVGDKIRIELCANPSTGYGWDYEMTEDNIVMEEDHDFDEPEGDVVGAPGIEFWTFEAVNPGNTEIIMEYTPPGTGNTEDSWTLQMSITVE
ncbi:MAG: protease inhibitor I42 family protein [Dehalococcoidales bacterium]|nr:MAG: protease inhibitor I42 family protein [Dehalococcoidales bacterium]